MNEYYDRDNNRYVDNMRLVKKPAADFSLGKLGVQLALVTTLAASAVLVGTNALELNCEVEGYYIDGYQVSNVGKVDDGYIIEYTDGQISRYTMEEMSDFIDSRALQAVTCDTPDGHTIRASVKHNHNKTNIESIAGIIVAGVASYGLSKTRDM